jgi:hypothetical protein
MLSVVIFLMISKNDINQQSLGDTIIALQNRGVEVLCDIPQTIPYIGSLKSSWTDEQEIYSVLDLNSPFYEKEKNVEKKLLEMIKGSIGNLEFPLDSFVLNQTFYSDETQEYQLYQKFQGGLVYNNYLKVVIQDEKAEVVGRYRKVEELEDKRGAIASNKVLLKNFLKSDVKRRIIGIDNGYLQKSVRTQDVDLVFVPVWRITMEGGKEIYFNAYTGDELAGF